MPPAATLQPLICSIDIDLASRTCQFVERTARHDVATDRVLHAEQLARSLERSIALLVAV